MLSARWAAGDAEDAEARGGEEVVREKERWKGTGVSD